MLLATALAPAWYYRMCSTTFTVQNKPAAVAPKETITHHFLRFWNWSEENCRCSKICGGAENVVKTEGPANIRKWIARFY